MKTKDKKFITVSDEVEQIKEEICDHYCKYTEHYSMEEYEEMLESTVTAVLCGGCEVNATVGNGWLRLPLRLKTLNFQRCYGCYGCDPFSIHF